MEGEVAEPLFVTFKFYLSIQVYEIYDLKKIKKDCKFHCISFTIYTEIRVAI